MPTEVIMPKVDMDMATGRIAAWHVAEGARVEKAAPLFDIETDKAAMEVESPASGFLHHVVAGAGAEVAIGQPVAWIYRDGEAVGPHPNGPAVSDPPGAPEPPVAASAEAPSPAAVAEQRAKPRATPLARKLAREAGIGLEGLAGTGVRGRIQADDVRGVAFAPTGRARVDAEASPAHGRHRPLPFVLIHGFAGDASTWAPLEARLPRERPLVRLELPSHGNEKLRRVASFADLVGEVRRAFDALGLEQAHLIGHSLGGAVALALADLRPRAVGSLTLLCPAGLGPEIDAAVLHGLARASGADSLAAWLRVLTADPDFISWNYVQAAMLRRADPKLRIAQSELAEMLFPDGVQSFDLKGALDRLEIPARIVWGRQDRIVPWRHALRAPGRVSLNLFEACGHLPHLEQAEALALLLRGLP